MTTELTFHGIQIGLLVFLISLVLSQHKIWVRMKDRLNSLWYEHCKSKNEKFVSLENGK